MYPVRMRQIYTKTTTMSTIAVTLCVSLLFAIPKFLTYYPQEATDHASSGFQLTKFGKSEAAIQFRFWCHFVFLTVVPWLVIGVLNLLVIKVYKDRNMTLESLVGMILD